MSERHKCCVPFCRRTRKPDPEISEWVCSAHWAMVPKRLKRAYSLAKRRGRRIIAKRPMYREYWLYKAGSPDRLSAIAMWKRLDGCWQRCRDAAIETAAGL